jgi:preprotein translocase subunit SecG
MMIFAAGFWLHFGLGALMFATALFLILLVLVQRGRGGGLTGALGGMGGQSAFGTKAGDIFTRITIVTAGVWILTCMLAIKLLDVPKFFGAATTEGTAVEAAPTPGTGTPEAPAPDSSAGSATSTAPMTEGTKTTDN